MVLLDTFAPLFSEFIEFDAKIAVKIPFLSKNARIQEYKNTRIQVRVLNFTFPKNSIHKNM